MAGSFSMITRSATTWTVGLILFSVVCYLPVAPVTALFFNYTSFSTHDSSDLRIEGEAYINRGWIDLTAFGDKAIDDSRGRVSYAGPMRLWDRDTGEVASFVTRFSFVIDPPSRYGGLNNKGAGMAFFLAGYPSSLPSKSETYNMGLTNQSADAVATGDGRFAAVEYDTFNDTVALDPHSTYDHLGIDVNSIRSVATEVLPSFSLVGNMTAEVRYDNVSTVLELKLWLGDGRNMSYNLSQKVDLKSALPEIVSVGFSASTGASVELHQLYSWYFNSSLESKATPIPLPPPTPSTSGSRRGGVVAWASVGAALFVVVLFALAVFQAGRRRRSKTRELELAKEFDEEDIGSSDDDDDDGHEPIRKIEMGTGPRRFPYHELVAATKNFAPEEKLGQGGFGSVYRGHLISDHNGGLAALLGGGVRQTNEVFRLVEWTWDLYGRGTALAAADERLNGEYNAAEVERVVAVGLWCAHPDPRARPSVREAMAALQSNGPVPPLPAKMPVPTYAVPVTSPEGLFSYTASTSGMTSLQLTQSSSMTITSAPNISAS
ncbi:unnamed protein product [Miscanthus lutarioriparius]|uniref:Legume lectin domain-containing protein n=1 Tax=Miscanthus lutarioriparius TaxID=422564 RepID=A0A811PY34_9POAL|nr:unnamed protein product [Miscanthus lutarioriparius]